MATRPGTDVGMTEFLILPGAVALILGTVDVGLAVGVKTPSVLGDPLLLSVPMVAATAIALVAFGVTWFVVCAPLRRLFELHPGRLLLAASAGLLVLGELASILTVVDASPRRELTLSVVVVSVLVGTLSYFSLPRPLVAQHLRLAGRFAVHLLAAILGLLVVAWLWRYGRGDGGSLSTGLALALAACLLGVVLTELAIAKLYSSRRAVAVLTLLLVVVFLVAYGARPRFQRGLPQSTLTLPSARNVFLVTVDTLRWDAPSYANSTTGESMVTPHIDAVARRSFAFERAYSPAPWTKPAMASILTGAAPAAHQVLDALHPVAEGFVTLAERLHDAGYSTAAVGESLLLKNRSGLDQGFDYFDFFPRRSLGPSLGARAMARVFPDLYSTRPATGEILTNRALAWLRKAAPSRRPLFLWLHYYSPHLPYAPPAELIPSGNPPSRIGRSFVPHQLRFQINSLSSDEKAWISALYVAEVRLLDREIGQLVTGLEELDMYDDSVFVFTSDHGEEFWEHDRFGHGQSLFDELIRVPMLIKLPGQGDGLVFDAPVSTAAIYSTVLDLVGVPLGPPASAVCLMANSLEPALMSPDWQPPPHVWSQGVLREPDQLAVIAGDSKFIQGLAKDDHRKWAFDLAQDPEEKTPVDDDTIGLGSRPAVHDYLNRAVLCRELVETGLDPNGEEDVDKDLMETLRALGYIQ